jgi:hypothetical protein
MVSGFEKYLNLEMKVWLLSAATSRVDLYVGVLNGS